MNHLQSHIKKFLDDRGWINLQPANLAKSISIEAAELLELFQWDNPTIEETLKDTPRMEDIQKELADIMIYCLQVSIFLKLDPEKIILDKLAHQSKKYPAQLMKNGTKTQAGQDAYYQIKKDYREKAKE